MSNILLNDGYNVYWRLPKIDFNKEYSKAKHSRFLDTLFYIFGKSRAAKWVLSFLYKYTHLEENKLNLFLDNGRINIIDNLMPPIVHHKMMWSTSYITENGDTINCISGPTGKYKYEQRRDFLFLLLKCKYNKEQANSILDYYSEITNLSYEELVKETKSNDYGWKDIANKMEYNKYGKVESVFNFIDEVLIESFLEAGTIEYM